MEHPECQHRVVDVRTFIDSPDYLNAKAECWPSVKDDLEALFNGKYVEAVFCEAIGSGKSYKSSLIMTYMAYRVLCLREPQRYFNLATGSGICFINMSIRAEQSRKVVFGEIKSRIDNSPWFRQHFPPDPDIKSELRFAKNITIFPGNSRETFPLGFNVLGGVMDEAAWYTETDDHDVAEEMFNALHSRIKNRFGERGLLVMISSPRYVDDFIELKMKEAETNPNIFCRRKMLWDSKPTQAFCGTRIEFQNYKIPIEFELEAKRNPESFKRDFMAIPAMALEPYFKRMDLIEKCIDPKLGHPFDENGRFKPWFTGKKGLYHYIHVDLGHKRDATGIAMAHDEGDNVIVDFMLQMKAPPGGEIYFSDIRDLIIQLKEKLGFKIDKVTYDGWQSIDSMQILREKWIKCELLSVDRDTSAYDTLKEKMYAGQLKCYRYEPFFNELKRLELLVGTKVDHPPHGSKDVADAVAGAVYGAVENAGMVREVRVYY